MISAWHDLLGNLGIVALFAAALAFGFDWIRQRSDWLQTAIIGTTAGACTCALLLMPITLQPGVIYDLRAVPVALAGFLWSPPAAVIAGVMAAICRVYLGGVGAAPAVFGMLVIVVTSIVGWMMLRGRAPTLRDMVLFGIAAAAASMSGWFATPPEIWQAALPKIGLPGVTLVFVAVVVAGTGMIAERRRRATAWENQVYRAVIDAMPEPISAKDVDGRFIAANPATAELMLASGPAALLGKTDHDFYPLDVASAFRADELSAIKSGKVMLIEQRAKRRDGSEVWLATLKAPLHGSDGTIVGLLTHNRDISELKVLEAQHEEAQRQLADALASMADGLVMFDRRQRLVLCNDRYREIFAKTAHLRVPGTPFADILRASIASGEQAGILPGQEEAWIARTCASLATSGEDIIELSGDRWFHTRVRLTADGGSLSVLSDVTEARRTQRQLSELNQQLAALARIDSLTGLTNRRAFDTALATEFSRSARAGTPLSLMFLDVDHFKIYNDAHGHPAGDGCLRAVARVIGDEMKRPGDLAARYGGEEFVAILPQTDMRGAAALAEMIRQRVRHLAIPNASTPAGIVTVSIGIATREGSASEITGEELVARADKALYAAKAAGRDRVMPSVPRLVNTGADSPTQAAAGGG
ncbi:MAG: diguanylate cyclase [Bauldia sp.]|nr:diguanylate cyclase [Bauldia sp.]